jgi:hypothetical protein
MGVHFIDLFYFLDGIGFRLPKLFDFGIIRFELVRGELLR